ncbi:D-3-phosphoglycerate dehydrogenase [Virgisporangium aliadipatigenens]|uniref:D-3-phosphoglycerate dehydrogenase n=1 Tax=Virgisporangium aliadipatigenens TaxID=741659 RepID=A0A8J4DPN9_9ACTN|nr:phosphoglycerate dehydrogenase [Virgisporangium aliadipatigenens]GIJ45699.1 D-3-phosphoglycerate dehydrogenase [Virgisporangium aliadipatigenens]
MTLSADRPVVLIAEELAPAALEVLADDFDVRHVDGTDRPKLLAALADAHAIIVRSATKVDAEAIAAGPRLKVVARAGVGLDNVEVPAATARGVMVVNAPTSNIVSAAEQAVALLLAVARHTASASTALKNGEWKRSKYTGVEIVGKTVGVVGLGRIGVLFAQRMAAFGTRLIAYDPYIQPARAAALGVRLVGLDELLRESDFISIHLPKTPETVGLIGAKELAQVKPGVRIVNAARGGLIDEQALADAIEEGRVGGAGIDVYAKEPCTSSPLFKFDNVVATPHLGASTNEAQDKAGLAVAKSVKLALQGEFVPDAVNVQAGGVVAEDVRPLLPLAEKLGQVFTAVAGGVAAAVTVEVSGEIVANDVSVLKLAATKGLFSAVVEDQVTYVNAPLLAGERGVELQLVTNAESVEHANLVTVRGALPDGQVVSVSGTYIAGPREAEKLTELDGFALELTAEGILLFFRYVDRPGVVGTVGSILGDAGVNIAAMQVARREAGGEALMTLTVDGTVAPDLLAKAAESIGATTASAVDLTQH